MKANHCNIILALTISAMAIACGENPKVAELGPAKTTGIPVPDVQVFRTMMPDAGPSAFAVRFTEAGLAMCYDPVRGGVNYLWKGDFDLQPTVTGKISKLAVVEGEPFYRETAWHPLRSSKSLDEPDYKFLGYSVKEGALEFNYAIDGEVKVRERITPIDGEGVRRDFLVENQDRTVRSLYLHLEPQELATVSVDGGTVGEDGWTLFQGEALRDFSITIHKKDLEK